MRRVRFSRLILFGLFCVPVVGAFSVALADPRIQRRILGTQSHEGIEVECAIEPVDHGRNLKVGVGESVRFLFSIRDTTTGLPVSGLFPAAWVQSRPEGVAAADRPDCREMVQSFIGGGLFGQADLDLNVYHVVTLNEDNTLSVVDPLFGFGGSKLLTMISLPGAGMDWVRMQRGPKLFVSLPETNQIAEIDTVSWRVSSLLPQVNEPSRLFLQPDENFLWAGTPGGVAVLSTEPFRLEHLIQTGKGAHEIAFSADSRYAFVTNRDDGTLAIVDLREFKILKTLATGEQPESVAYDSHAEAVYVSHAKSGTIACVDAIEHELYKTIPSEPGLGEIRFAPGGRWGFLVNPETNRLSIIDASLDRIVQTGIVEGAPTEIAFSDNFAYIRHRDDATLLLVPLDGGELGREGARIPVIEVPGGDAAYGTPANPSPAATLVQSPGANAVLIANPKDQAIYFYKEGMAAPMGQFNNYGHEPRAVLVVDRSLREASSPGVYETVGRLRKPGINDIVFFTDSPRMALCFEVRVDASDLTESEAGATMSVEPLEDADPILTARKPARLQFKFTDFSTGDPVAAGENLRVSIHMTPGSWRKNQPVELQPGSVASVDFTPPLPGIYQVTFESGTSGARVKQSKRFVYEARAE